MTFMKRLTKNPGTRFVYGMLAACLIVVFISIIKWIPLLVAAIILVYVLGWAIDDIEDWWLERQERKEKP